MSFKRHVSYTLIAQILTTVLSFASSIFITRILGATGRGENAIFTNSLNLAILLFGFSINSTITFFINTGKVKQNELFSTILLIVSMSTILVFISLFVMVHLHFSHLIFPENCSSTMYILFFALLFFCTLLTNVIISLFATLKLFKQSSILMVLFILIPLIIYMLIHAGVLPQSSKGPFTTVLYITLGNSILSVITYWYILTKKSMVRITKSLISIDQIRQFAKFTLMAYVANVIQFFAYKLDFWLVDHYCGKHDLGVYSLASQLAQMLWIIPSAIGAVVYSQISNEDLEQPIPKKYINIIPLIFYISIIGAIVGLIISYYFIPVLFGDEFIASYQPLLVFLLGTCLLSFATVITTINAGRGRFKDNYLGSIVGFVISLLTYPVFIKNFGMIGGAAATTIVYLAQTIFYTYYFCKKEKILYKQIFSLNLKSIKKLS